MIGRIYVVTRSNGDVIRIRASAFRDAGSNGLLFYDEDFNNPSAAVRGLGDVCSVIPQDMLLETVQDSPIYPGISPVRDDGIEFLTNALFSNAEKRPFTPEERRLLEAALQEAKQAIRDTFETKESQQGEIDHKLDYLTAKVAELDKRNWKRLFISTLVGVSVDLFFGTMVPAALLNIFKEVLSHLLEKRKALPPAPTPSNTALSGTSKSRE